jgi:hypothetical protein
MRESSLVAVILLLAGCGDSGTYPKQCGQLLPGWVTNERGFGTLGIASDVRLHKDGRVSFNRKPVTDQQLVEFSRITGEMDPWVFVTVAIDDGASCERVRAVRAIIDKGIGCNGERRGTCGEGPGPWPVFGDVPPFPIVEEYQDGKYRWLEKGVSDEEWRAKNVRKPTR